MPGTHHFRITWNRVKNAQRYLLERDFNRVYYGEDTTFIDKDFFPRNLYPDDTERVAEYRVIAIGKNEQQNLAQYADAMYEKPKPPEEVEVDTISEDLRISWKGTVDLNAPYNYYIVSVREHYEEGGASPWQTIDEVSDSSNYEYRTSRFFYDYSSVEYGTDYGFKVNAVRYGVQGNSEYSTGSLGNLPPIRDFSFAETRPYEATISWECEVQRASPSYRVYATQSKPTNPFEAISDDLMHNREWKIEYMLPGVPYYITIETALWNVAPTFSDTFMVHWGDLIETPPKTPDTVNARALGMGDVMQVFWNLVPGATEYMVYRADRLTDTYEPVSGWIKPSYPLTRGGFRFSDGTEFGFFDDGVTYRDIYFYRVKARNQYGESELGNYGYGAIWNNSWSVPEPVTPVAAVDSISGGIRLSWNDPGNVVAFNVLRGETNNIHHANTIADSITTISFEDRPATDSDTLYYWIECIGYYENTTSKEPVEFVFHDSELPTASIYITVADSCANKELENAEVIFECLNKTTFTDSTGFTMIEDIPVNSPDSQLSCNITVKKNGYREHSSSVTLKGGFATGQTIRLLPNDGCIADTLMTLELVNPSASEGLNINLYLLVPSENDEYEPMKVGFMIGDLFTYPFAELEWMQEIIHISRFVEGTYKIFAEIGYDPGQVFERTNAQVIITDLVNEEELNIYSENADGDGSYWYLGTITDGTIDLINELRETEP
ncbi:fibronectin type III domain-containing protein [Chitinispirillales bacterium ANBcel5]|uniref:hypothetical protein n=1 Tax=Cellulosispirillum alkaliphilum TaxID=3039283 RepID=UPI002A50AF54|nr:fibronectin type III domain-containing protein [Chitinispirillales bacterium ANBcel5]